jgi:hypothetical protein
MERPSDCGCDEEECICHFYHYDCACDRCPDCADDCFCFEEAHEEGKDIEPLTLMEVFEQHPELMGERAGVDPFEDDEIIECDLENPDICESCQ